MADRTPGRRADDADHVGRHAIQHKVLRRDDLDIEIRHHERRGVDAALLNNRHLAQAPLFAGMTTRTTERACSLFRISVMRSGISDDVATGEVAERPDHDQMHVHGSSSIQAVMDAVFSTRSPNSIAGLALETIVGYSTL